MIAAYAIFATVLLMIATVISGSGALTIPTMVMLLVAAIAWICDPL